MPLRGLKECQQTEQQQIQKNAAPHLYTHSRGKDCTTAMHPWRRLSIRPRTVRFGEDRTGNDSANSGQSAIDNAVQPFHDGAIRYYKEKGIWSAKLETKQRSFIGQIGPRIIPVGQSFIKKYGIPPINRSNLSHFFVVSRQRKRTLNR